MQNSGRTRPGSGNQWHSRGDVRSAHYLISCKRTDKDGYRVTKRDWCEVTEASFSEDRHPAMAIELSGLNLYVIGEDLFNILTQALQEEKERVIHSNTVPA